MGLLNNVLGVLEYNEAIEAKKQAHHGLLRRLSWRAEYPKYKKFNLLKILFNYVFYHGEYVKFVNDVKEGNIELYLE